MALLQCRFSPWLYVRSALTQTSPISRQCSVKDFVNPWFCRCTVPKAAKSPCGCVAVADVFAICVMFIGELPPPRYSGRCSLASGDVTPKCDLMISVYLVPPLASLSRSFCIWNASLSWLIVAAVAVDRSAYILLVAASVVFADTCHNAVSASMFWKADVLSDIIPTVVPTPAAVWMSAVVPSGMLTGVAPFCGHGRADVK